MSKTLMFVFPNIPITENAEGGGGLVIKNHLQLLKGCFDEIHLVLVQYENESDQFDLYFSKHLDELAELKLLYTSKRSVHLSVSQARSRLLNYFHLVFHPVAWTFPFINNQNVLAIDTLKSNIQPDVIWTEHLTAGLLCFYAFKNKRKTLVYTHHDWEYKLRKLRNPSRNSELSYSIRSLLTKLIEVDFVKRTGAVISSSWSEFQDCLQLGLKKVMYVPLFVAEPIMHLKNDAEALDRFKVFHLGGMKTTANRIGLENFFRHCWPALKKEIPEIELFLIGSMNGVSNTLLPFLDDPSVHVMGYVENIDSALSPYSIHIIPWNQNTGVRTKVPIALRNKQVIVGMKKSLECFIELTDSENALLVDEYDDLTEAIIRLRKDLALLHQMGNQAFNAFQKSFVVNAHKESFLNFMKSMI
jgi:glycosyltransferase involved in cell wall biosynthesis